MKIDMHPLDFATFVVHQEYQKILANEKIKEILLEKIMSNQIDDLIEQDNLTNFTKVLDECGGCIYGRKSQFEGLVLGNDPASKAYMGNMFRTIPVMQLKKLIDSYVDGDVLIALSPDEGTHAHQNWSNRYTTYCKITADADNYIFWFYEFDVESSRLIYCFKVNLSKTNNRMLEDGDLVPILLDVYLSGMLGSLTTNIKNMKEYDDMFLEFLNKAVAWDNESEEPGEYNIGSPDGQPVETYKFVSYMVFAVLEIIVNYSMFVAIHKYDNDNGMDIDIHKINNTMEGITIYIKGIRNPTLHAVRKTSCEAIDPEGPLAEFYRYVVEKREIKSRW